MAFEGRSLIRVVNRSEGHVKVEADWVSLPQRECSKFTLKVEFVRKPGPLGNVLVDILSIFVEETPVVLPKAPVLSLL